MQKARHVGSKSRIATVVRYYLFAVDIHRGGRVGTLDFDIISIGLRKVGLGDSLEIAACPAIVIVATVLTVGRVPSMRQVDGLSVARYAC